jgi:hypothetical protein
MRKQTFVIGMLVVTIALLLVARPNASQTTQAHTGRWQIVNGTPQLSENIMLLDTETGNSWITCNLPSPDSISEVSTGWCALTKTDRIASRMK